MRTFLLYFVVVCAFAAAMVPRERRAVNSEELPMISTTTTRKPREICAPETPCGWATYSNAAKMIVEWINNTYCNCSDDTVCQQSEEEKGKKLYIYKCRLPLLVSEEEWDAAES